MHSKSRLNAKVVVKPTEMYVIVLLWWFPNFQPPTKEHCTYHKPLFCKAPVVQITNK